MRRESVGSASLGLVDDLLTWALRLGAAALVLVTAYYIYGVAFASAQLFRGLDPSGRPMSPEEFQRNLGNLSLLTKALQIGAVLVVIAALGKWFSNIEAGAALLLVGVALFLGMPLLIDNVGGPAQELPRTLARLGNPRAYLRGQYVMTGVILGLPAILHLIFHAIAHMATAGKRKPQANAEAQKTASQVRKAEDKFLGKCWQLPFCRDTDKKLCPVRQKGKPCWRSGRGCYCDQNIILTISGGSAYSASRGSAGYLSAAASSRPKSWSEKRAQCLACPVYLHHQEQKHKLAVPFVLLAILGGGYMVLGQAREIYPAVMHAVGRAFVNLNFGPSPGGVPGWANDLAANTWMMYLLMGVAALLILAYAVQGVEWLLYRLGV